MTTSQTLSLWAATLILATGTAFAEADDAHVHSIIEHRRAIEAEFRIRETSPLTAGDFDAFQGLSYFPVKTRWRVEARFEPAENTATFRMPTFNNRFMDFSAYGHLTCTTPDGREARLTLFRREDIGELGRTFALIPFRDLTNGETTYPGGRYLEIELPLSDPPVIDFNRASNPYCAYNDNLTCPIPPRQNWLGFPIPAGEKAFH